LGRITVNRFDFKVWENNSFINNFDIIQEWFNADGEIGTNGHIAGYEKGSFGVDIKHQSRVKCRKMHEL
jgi:hypothetical protein